MKQNSWFSILGLGISLFVLLGSLGGSDAQEGEKPNRPTALATPKPSTHLSTSRVASVWQKGVDGENRS